jgi:hypothetical protein
MYIRYIYGIVQGNYHTYGHIRCTYTNSVVHLTLDGVNGK